MTKEPEEVIKAKEEQDRDMEALIGKIESCVHEMNRSSRLRGRLEVFVGTLGGVALVGLIAWGIRKRK